MKTMGIVHQLWSREEFIKEGGHTIENLQGPNAKPVPVPPNHHVLSYSTAVLLYGSGTIRSH